MRSTINPQVLATDLADYLVKRDVPFRQAHHAVGQAVRRADELNVTLSALPLLEWQIIHPAFAEDLFKVFDLEHSIAQRTAWGGTAPMAVKEQLELVKRVLSENKRE
jgi:argininosuccinate lyase